MQISIYNQYDAIDLLEDGPMYEGYCSAFNNSGGFVNIPWITSLNKEIHLLNNDSTMLCIDTAGYYIFSCNIGADSSVNTKYKLGCKIYNPSNGLTLGYNASWQADHPEINVSTLAFCWAGETIRVETFLGYEDQSVTLIFNGNIRLNIRRLGRFYAA